MKIEKWNDYEIRFVEKEPSEWWVVAGDVAKAAGYTPLDEFLNCDEFIDETFTISDFGEYLALTNKNRLLIISHWYGDSERIIVPNVARTVQSILVNNNQLGKEFKKVLKSLLNRHYLLGFRSKLPKGIRRSIELLIGYEHEETFVSKQKRKVTNTNSELEYVYFLTADNGFTKIGRTKKLDERIHHFTTKLPYKLEERLFLKTSNSSKLESSIHKRFESKRKRGEWFLLTDDDIELLKKEFRDLITTR